MSIREEMVHDWLEASRTLRKAKARELELRNKILPHILKDKIKGTATAIFGGYKMKGTARLNYIVDKDALDGIITDLTETEQACLVWKPSVTAKLFEALPGDNVLSQVVTIKPGQGSLVAIEGD